MNQLYIKNQFFFHKLQPERIDSQFLRFRFVLAPRERAWAAHPSRRSHPWEESQRWNLSIRLWFNRNIWSGKFHAWSIPTYQHANISYQQYQHIKMLTCHHIILRYLIRVILLDPVAWLPLSTREFTQPSHSFHTMSAHTWANRAICQRHAAHNSKFWMKTWKRKAVRGGMWNFFDLSSKREQTSHLILRLGAVKR